MPEDACIRAGGLDNGGASMGNTIHIEFYTKDRVGYLGSLESAKQELKLGG
jgi:hypothetical protein